MITIILAVIIILIVAVFSVQNAAPAAISFLFWRFDASLAIVIFLSVFAGLIIGVTIMSWFRIKRSQREKKESSEKPGSVQ